MVNQSEIKRVNRKDEYNVRCSDCRCFSFTAQAKRLRLGNLEKDERDRIKKYIATANENGNHPVLTIDKIHVILTGTTP